MGQPSYGGGQPPQGMGGNPQLSQVPCSPRSSPLASGMYYEHMPSLQEVRLWSVGESQLCALLDTDLAGTPKTYKTPAHEACVDAAERVPESGTLHRPWHNCCGNGSDGRAKLCSIVLMSQIVQGGQVQGAAPGMAGQPAQGSMGGGQSSGDPRAMLGPGQGGSDPRGLPGQGGPPQVRSWLSSLLRIPAHASRNHFWILHASAHGVWWKVESLCALVGCP